MTTNENRTASMLQRVPKILAVTANSYGLTFEPGTRKPVAAGERRSQKRHKSAQDGKPMAHR